MTKEHFKKVRWTGQMKAVCSGSTFSVYSCDFSKYTVTLQLEQGKPFTVPCEIVEIVGQEEPARTTPVKSGNPVIDDDEWRNRGRAIFGDKNRDNWLYSCPQCHSTIDSYSRCPQCNCTNTVKQTPPLQYVLFCGCKIPVFPFAEGQREY